MRTAALNASWSFNNNANRSAADFVNRINSDLREIADFSMPHNSGTQTRATYWWNADLTTLRNAVNKKRRALSRAKRKGDVRLITVAYEERF